MLHAGHETVQVAVSRKRIETTDFSGLDKFNRSVSDAHLLTFCQVNFT